MAREIWKGSLSFGLVEIPIALVAAESRRELKLSFLDRRDFSPVGYSRYNKTTEDEVPWSEIVHGYEYKKGEYVVLSQEDLKRANPELTRTIQILHFVDAAQIEPIYFDTPYYLDPVKPKSKGYVLLRETMRRTKKVGIAKVALRTREHVAAVTVRDQALMLQLLRFESEVRAPSELENADFDLKDVGVTPKEIEMASRLVEDMLDEWKPADYEDEYTSDLLALIERKIDSGAVHVLDESEPEEQPRARGEIFDLMPLLKKSVEAARGKDGKERAAGRGGTRGAPAPKGTPRPRATRKAGARARKRPA
jgi:DNA end-binding protein Ku